MKHSALIFYLLISFLLISVAGEIRAQETKDEVEKSIGKGDMPASSINLLNKFWKDHEKADFYREQDGDTISYEAKITWNGYLYSIEFYEDGSLMDIEQLISFEEIPEASQNTITNEIKQQFSKFSIRRTQRQFRDSSDASIKMVLAEDVDDLDYRYEIVIDGENKDTLGSFELVFDKNGKLLQQRRIVRRSLDNIW